MLKPTDNFLNWYKLCCEADASIYRQTKYNKNKAKLIFISSLNFDFVVYPLNGSQNIFYGSKSLCEQYIQENLNTKFFVFSLKKDIQKDYAVFNEKVEII